MVLVYHCDGRYRLSLIMAKVHLMATREGGVDWELLNEQLRSFAFRRGELVFVGLDGSGNEVYALNRAGFGELLERLVYGLSPLLGVQIKCIDASRHGGLSFRLVRLLCYIPFIGVLLSKTRIIRKLEVRFREKAFNRMAGARDEYARREASEQAIVDSAKLTPGVPNSTEVEPVTDRPPKVFYCCYGSAHTSVVAASIHAGILPVEKPDWEEIAGLPWFDELPHGCVGIPVFVGMGSVGEEVYAIGTLGARSEVLEPVLTIIDRHVDLTRTCRFVEVSQYTNWLAKVGGILSRRLGVVGVGRRLAAIGMCYSYSDISSLVQEVARSGTVR